MIKAIIFDCFGVLYPHASVDFYNRHKELFLGHPDIIDELNLKIDLGEINRRQFFEGIEAATGIPASQVQNEFDVQRTPDQGLVTLIRKLKSNYKIGLLSNAAQEEIDCVFRDKIDTLFDAMAISFEVGVVKPNAKIFLVCAQRLAVKPEECLFIDDSLINIKAAQKLKMKTLYYPSYGIIPEELRNLTKVQF